MLAGPEDAWDQQLDIVTFAQAREHWIAFAALAKSGRKHPKLERPVDDEDGKPNESTHYLQWTDTLFFDEVRVPSGNGVTESLSLKLLAPVGLSQVLMVMSGFPTVYANLRQFFYRLGCRRFA